MGAKKITSLQIFIIATFFLLMLILTVLCVGLMVKYDILTDVTKLETISYWKDRLPIEQTVWYDNGIEELNFALYMVPPDEKARNIIIYVVNGITPEELAAVRFANNSTKNIDMSWDIFPYMARIKNSCGLYNICDAATTATSLFGGVKTTFGVGGLDAAVSFHNCTQALNVTHHVKSILDMAQKTGNMRTGLVTTGRVTAPFLAPLYAHIADSSFECDSTVPSKDCLNIANQLATSETAQNLNVIMGGGRQTLVTNIPITAQYPIDAEACRSELKNGNIERDWAAQHLAQQHIFAVAHNWQELESTNGSYVDYFLGIYANGNIETKTTAQPELFDMVYKARQMLQRDNKGYMLIVNKVIKDNTNNLDKIEQLLELNSVIERTYKAAE